MINTIHNLFGTMHRRKTKVNSDIVDANLRSFRLEKKVFVYCVDKIIIQTRFLQIQNNGMQRSSGSKKSYHFHHTVP